MNKSLLAPIATLVLAAGLIAQSAEATPPAPVTLDIAATPAAPIVRVVVLCGVNGCAPVQVSGPRRYKKLPKAMGR